MGDEDADEDAAGKTRAVVVLVPDTEGLDDSETLAEALALADMDGAAVDV